MSHSPSSPTETPLISVVVPAYNAEKYLRQTLESVRAQTRHDWECIVVDDGSRDATAQIAREMVALDARIRLVQKDNEGVSVARNTGFSHADPDAEFVAFLDADDLWEPPLLQTLTETLEAHPEAVAAHCNAFYIDSEGARISEGVLEEVVIRRYFYDGRQIRRSEASDPTTFAHAVTNCPIITPGSTVIRREAFERIGGFSPDFQQQEDWDVWVRLARLSDIRFVNQPLLAYRRHESNASLNRRLQAVQGQDMRRRLINAPENTPEQRRLALGAYRAFYWYLARLRYPSAWQYARKRNFKQGLQTLILALVNTAMALKGRP